MATDNTFKLGQAPSSIGRHVSRHHRQNLYKRSSGKTKFTLHGSSGGSGTNLRSTKLTPLITQIPLCRRAEIKGIVIPIQWSIHVPGFFLSLNQLGHRRHFQAWTDTITDWTSCLTSLPPKESTQRSPPKRSSAQNKFTLHGSSRGSGTSVPSSTPTPLPAQIPLRTRAETIKSIVIQFRWSIHVPGLFRTVRQVGQ